MAAKHAINRRHFVGTTVASSMFAVVPRHVLGGPRYVAPSEKIRLAHIGMGTQGFRELGGLLGESKLQIVAVCDPNTRSNDYVEWGKNGIRNTIRKYLGNPTWQEGVPGCPGGREVGREVVDTYYARQTGSKQSKGCNTYADFRELLDQEKDLDAVKIMTPDHLHATIAIAAMKRGLHVMVHKPVGNRLAEARMVIDTTRATGCATHLLAYGAGEGNRLICKKIKQGVIGNLKEIHNWTNRPVWPQYIQIPQDRPPVPKGFDWNLWLGPARERPYHPHYTHTVFRGWYDFGGGSMADMGIYSLWPVFATLGLESPVRADAWATHSCTIEDNVSRTIKNDFSYPTGCRLHFEFAAHGTNPAMELFWYDGGMKPRLPDIVESHGIEMGREGILFVGDQGAILGEFHGDNPHLFTKGKKQRLDVSDTDTQANTQPSQQRWAPWLAACAGGPPSPGNFLNAGPISDTVNLGTVALRAGSSVRFDSRQIKITSPGRADRFLYREYRKGWELTPS